MENVSKIALRLSVAVVLAVFALALVIGAIRGPVVKSTAPAPAPVVAEDDTAWDCASMGNDVCGPGSVPLSTYCQAEPSATVEGVEIIAYPSGQVANPGRGVPVPCDRG